MSEAKTFLMLQTTITTGVMIYNPKYKNSVYEINSAESKHAYIMIFDCMLALLEEGSNIRYETDRLRHYAMSMWANSLPIQSHERFTFKFYSTLTGCYRIKPMHGKSFRIKL